MSCGECCKQFWFKIMYLVLVGGIFLAITLISWSIYATTSVLNKDYLLMDKAMILT